jgi:hypothetical protein
MYNTLMDSDIPTLQSSQGSLPPELQGMPQSQDYYNPSFTWAAGHLVIHKKTARWYASFVLVTIVAVALIYLLTKDTVTAVIFIVTAILFVVAATRKPKHLKYALDGYGLHIGRKMYAYNMFRSFSVIDEGHVSCIMFRPLQLFVPQIAVYYDQKDEDKIINVLFGRLPIEDYRPDLINWFLDRVRF